MAPLIEEVILTAASGALVPRAAIVRPMMIVGMWKIAAMAEHPSTNISAPLIRKKKPASRII